MSNSATPSSVFHKLVVQLSKATSSLSLDKLSRIGSLSLVQQVLTNHPAIFARNDSCYTITSTSSALILSTYLSLSRNVTTRPSKKVGSEYHFHSFMVKASSSHFSSIHVIPSQSPPNDRSVCIFLPGSFSYFVPCPLFNLNFDVTASESPLLASVKFAVNSCQQLMCLVMTLSKDGKLLTSSSPSQSHIPLWTRECNRLEKLEVFVKSDIVNKDRQVNMSDVQQMVLMFKAWVLMIKYSEEGVAARRCTIAIKVMTEMLTEVLNVSANDECVSMQLGKYRAIFSVSDLHISLQPTTPSYWSQLFLLCSNITPAHGLSHVPLSPIHLSITLAMNKVVLRDLQGMVLPTSNENIFNVMFRFSEAADGFLVTMQNSKMMVPPEGKLIPLTLVIQAMNKKRGVVVVPSLGTWRHFNANWPKGESSCQFQISPDDDDLEMLLDAGPTLSSGGDADAIITLEEENTI